MRFGPLSQMRATTNQVSHQRPHTIVLLAVQPVVLDRDVSAVGIAKFGQTRAEAGAPTCADASGAATLMNLTAGLRSGRAWWSSFALRGLIVTGRVHRH